MRDPGCGIVLERPRRSLQLPRGVREPRAGCAQPLIVSRQRLLGDLERTLRL